MRKIIVMSFISIDGVMQAPGGPGEDSSNGFEYGGWLAPYGDDEFKNAMAGDMKSADILLGRKTFDIFESFWPANAEGWPGINDVNKYVLSESRTSSDWNKSVFLKTVSDIKKLKESDGGDLQVWGSSDLVHANELVDELRLKIFPVLLGKGKKLFDESSVASSFTLTRKLSTSRGVIIADYARAGEVKTGTVDS